MKNISLFIVFVLVLSMSMFGGCGNNPDGNLAIELLTKISQGNWDEAFDLTHPAMVFCGPDKDSFVAQMPYYGEELEKFFKGAEFEITKIEHVDEWSLEGIPFTDVSKVTIAMSTPTPRKAIENISMTKDFEESGFAELLVTPDPFTEEQTRKVVFSYGPATNALIIQASIEDNEYSSPVPNKTVSDPEPGTNAEPSTLEFFDIFDENYQRKYVSCVLKIGNTKASLGINPEGKILFFKPIDPPVRPQDWQVQKFMWESFIGITPDTISSFLPPEPAEYNYGAITTEMREKVAQALKLFVIMNDGYGKFKERFPRGILSLAGGTKIFLPNMTTVEGKTLTTSSFSGGNVAFIYISSCGSCMNRAVEVWTDLVKFGLDETRVVFISHSPQDKLKGFESRVGSSPLVIDLSKDIISALGLFGTPSMTVLNENSLVIVSLDSHELKNTSDFNHALGQIFGKWE